MKQIIRRLLPQFCHTIYMIFQTYLYDCRQMLKFGFAYRSEVENLKANLLMVIHTIEKGLTMPDAHVQFGLDKLKLLSSLILRLGDKEKNSFEVKYAISIMKEYVLFHRKKHVDLTSEAEKYIIGIIGNIAPLDVDKMNDISGAEQMHFEMDSFFDQGSISFKHFIYSRHTVRNYINKPIPSDVFVRIAELANRAPSSCNRQSCKIHVVTEINRLRQVLACQSGCRGFGHLAGAALIITSDLGCFFDVQERLQPAINAGFFGMNILYALHLEKLGACVLNWSNTKKRDKQLRSLVPTIEDNEQILFIICCGYTPDEFEVALSLRKDVSECISFVDNVE